MTPEVISLNVSLCHRISFLTLLVRLSLSHRESNACTAVVEALSHLEMDGCAKVCQCVVCQLRFDLSNGIAISREIVCIHIK